MRAAGRRGRAGDAVAAGRSARRAGADTWRTARHAVRRALRRARRPRREDGGSHGVARGSTGPVQLGTPGLLAPRVELGLRLPLPGAGVRLLPVALAVAAGSLAGVAGGGWLVLGGLALLLALRPALPVAAGVVLVVGLATLAGPDLLAPPGTDGDGTDGSAGPLRALRLAVLAPFLEATVRLAALAPHVAWTGRVEAPVLAAPARRVLTTQAVVQPVLWLAYGWRALGSGTEPGTGAGGGDAWRLVALVAVAVLLVLLVTRRDRPPGGPGP